MENVQSYLNLQYSHFVPVVLSNYLYFYVILISEKAQKLQCEGLFPYIWW